MDTYDMHTYAYDTTNVLKFILYFLLKKRAIKKYLCVCIYFFYCGTCIFCSQDSKTTVFFVVLTCVNGANTTRCFNVIALPPKINGFK